jgi:DNA-binding NtrC family response regulator
MIKVFCIDDEANTEKMMSKFEIMKDKGIEVIPEIDISNVMPRLDKLIRDIQLILLDIIIPPLEYYSLKETNGGTGTGIRLLKDIRSKYIDIPIIIISIKRISSEDEIFKKYNVLKLIEKPFSAASLIGEIKRALSKINDDIVS